MKWRQTRYPGISQRHKMIGQRGDLKPCPGDTGGRCRCNPSYRVRYRDDSGEPKWSKVKASIDEARSWQTDQRNGKTPEAVAGRSCATFNEMFAQFIKGARSGQITTRTRQPYAARSLDIYEANYNRHVEPTYGEREAAGLTAVDWQLLIDALSRSGLKHNTLQVVLTAVRVVYRWACAPSRRLLDVNETRGVEMPAKDETRRDRIVPIAEARLLLDALSQPCDVLDFALALYAGLRNKERWGLQWTDLLSKRTASRRPVANGGRVEGVSSGSDVPGGPFDTDGPTSFRIISIRRAITKSNAGVRKLPVIGWLRPILMREWLRQGKPTSGPVLVYPHGGKGENAYKKQAERAEKAWMAHGLNRITPHEGRHTFASYLIASGLNAKAVTVLMGHASVTETFDRYGHLFPGHEDEAAGLLDAYLGVPDSDREEVTA